MSLNSTFLSESIQDYLQQYTLRESTILQQLREETASLPNAQMQISPLQAQFMQLIIKLSGSKNILELGTFTGYSALAMALALPVEGTILTCDIDAETTLLAKKYWAKANVADKIKLQLGDALSSLQELVAASNQQFDFIFIDADKTNYPAYYELGLKLLKPGGLILLDNSLLQGSVVEQKQQRAKVMHELNHKIAQDERVDMSLVPIGDGLLMARKLG